MNRRIPLGAATVILVILALWPPSPAGSDDDARAATDLAAEWLAAQPTSGHSLEERIDLLIALEVAGVPKPVLEPLLTEVEFLLAQGAEASARVLAKAVVAFDVAGRTTTVGGRDLVGELRATSGNQPDAVGRYRADFGDELSTQAWGIIAELRGGGSPVEEVELLGTWQCPEGSFVVSPTLQSCGQQINVQDQALVLTALVGAAEAGVSTGGAPGRLADWLDEQRWVPDARYWPNTGASALAWLVWPLEATGRSDAAAGARNQLRGLQITPEVALHEGQVGAIGGETLLSLGDLLQQRLDPSADLTATGLVGLSRVDLTTYDHQERPSLVHLIVPGPHVIGLDDAEPDQTASFLAQGFAPGEEITLTIAGVSGTVARAAADGSGTATLTFTTQPLGSTTQALTFAGASGETVERTLNVVRPLIDRTDSSAGSVRAIGSTDAAFELSLPRAIAAGAALVVVLCAGAWLLRPDAREPGRP